MNIGPVKLPNNLILSPMAGITNLPFRLICKEYGAGLVFSEMISAEALVRGNSKTFSMLETDLREGPLAFQIFGGKKEILRDAVSILQDTGAKIIDLNLGCPIPKVGKSGAGAVLAKTPLALGEILKEMVRVASVPISIKIRTGWNERSINCLEVCRIAQDCGVSAISIHGRTVKQRYTGKADWEIIRAARDILSIPLIGNGDVVSPEDAKRMLEETGCAGVMIGRGSLGNPWIFRETLHYFEMGKLPPGPSPQERTSTMLKHLRLSVEKFGEDTGVRMMRKFWGFYIKGYQGSASLRDRLVRMENRKDISRAILDFF